MHLLYFALALLSPFFSTAAEIGSVVYLQGQAAVLRGGKEERLTQGEGIFSKDRIRAAQLSSIRLLLGEQCSIMIYGNGELRVNGIETNKGRESIYFDLVSVAKNQDTNVRMIASQVIRPRECRLFTPTAQIRSVEGEAIISYTPRLGMTEVIGLNGEVGVSGGEGSEEIIIQKNEISRIAIDGKPSAPIDVNPGQVNRLIGRFPIPIEIPKISKRAHPWRSMTQQ